MSNTHRRGEIYVAGLRKHLGYFRDLEDAVEARQKAAKKLLGEFLNESNP